MKKEQMIREFNSIMIEKNKIIVFDYLKREFGNDFMKYVTLKTPASPYDSMNNDSINIEILYKGKKIAMFYIDGKSNLNLQYTNSTDINKYFSDVYIFDNINGEHDVESLIFNVLLEKLNILGESGEKEIKQQQFLVDSSQDLFFVDGLIYANVNINNFGVSTLTIYKR